MVSNLANLLTTVEVESVAESTKRTNGSRAMSPALMMSHGNELNATVGHPGKAFTSESRGAGARLSF